MASITTSVATRDQIGRDFEAAKSLRDAEDVLVAHIRAEAASRPAVGKNCISVAVPPVGDVLIRYHPFGPLARTPTQVGSLPIRVKVPLMHSPWIIEPGQIMAPCDMSGNWTSTNRYLRRQYRFGVVNHTFSDSDPKFVQAAQRPKRPKGV